MKAKCLNGENAGMKAKCLNGENAGMKARWQTGVLGVCAEILYALAYIAAGLLIALLIAKAGA